MGYSLRPEGTRHELDLSGLLSKVRYRRVLSLTSWLTLLGPLPPLSGQLLPEPAAGHPGGDRARHRRPQPAPDRRGQGGGAAARHRADLSGAGRAAAG